jgi:hypothetical protein
MPLVNLKCISIAFALVLTVVATVAYAQQQASCEQNRLQCQKDWAQTNSFGVPVTPPDKTKLCWDGFYACTSAGLPPGQPPAPAPPPPPAVACEQQRLTCQKTWAQNNSSGVPATPPDKTKLCWDGYNACVAAGNAKQDAAPKAASLPPMKRFEMRSGGEFSYIEDCRIDGNEVRCTGRMERLPPNTINFEATMTGRISGSVITGASSSRSDQRGDGNSCSAHTESSWPVTVTLRPNNEATVQSGLIQFRMTRSGPGACTGGQTGTNAGSQHTVNWRVIE